MRSFNGQPVALRVTGDPDGGDGLYYLHGDHLGSLSLMTDSSGALVADSIARFLPFGGYRSDGSQPVDGNDLSDRGFTGHYENREIGLTYMQARYYAPELRRFISADTIVPDPTNPQSYNRYSYVLGNPINFFDPTGNFGVCFQGGTADEAGDGPVEDMCADLAAQGLVGESGEYRTFCNSNACIKEALKYLEEMLLMHPDDPIILLGYSWGGGASLELANYLNENETDITIDALILIDPVISGRFASLLPLFIDDRGFHSLTRDEHDRIVVPDNVVAAFSLTAGRNEYFGTPFDQGIHDIQGAVNKELLHDNHCTIGWSGCRGPGLRLPPSRRFSNDPDRGRYYSLETYIWVSSFLRELAR